MPQTFTVKEIVDAAKKNGLKHVRYTYYSGIGKKLSGCIMGQAAYNLNSENFGDDDFAERLVVALNQAADGLGGKMINLNDEPTESGKYRKYSDLVKRMENEAQPFLDREVIVLDELETDWDDDNEESI